MQADDFKQALARAMDLLARREHSAVELQQKLERKGFDSDCAEQAIAELGAEGLQSDERYAQSVVSARVGQGKGPLHILHGLKQYGVAAAIAEAALAAAQADWFALAIEARAKRFGLDRVVDARDHGRQMRFLLQRGFTAEQAHKALDSQDFDFEKYGSDR